MRLWPRSLTFRVIALSSIWAILALIVVFTLITTLYRQASERGFDSLLSAHLFNLISSVGISADGRMMGTPDLGDLRFSEPRSGWYWSVEPVSEGLSGELHSSSMTDPIPSPHPDEVPFNVEFQRSYLADGLGGEQIAVFESEFVLGTGNQIARFRVMGNESELESEISVFQRSLLIYLSIFGFGMIAINAIAILYGLKPLRRVRDALAMVREGTAQRLDGRFPAEIQPLANETNTLIENNRRIVERSRTQVGNLAHSLKTPLAVLINEGHALGGAKGRLITEQASSMQQQVEHYLQRARVAAQRDSVVYRTSVNPLIERLVRVVGKLNPNTQLSLSLPSDSIVFAGERADLEELLGNLLENAMKWARSQVFVSLVLAPAIEGQPDSFEIHIEDDGPGIPPDKAREALRRGQRLDESKPGTGLGLAIVTDLVNEYGGWLGLEQSRFGGLKATVRLRRIE
ncbi:ATP-binding protein [Aquamicrobium segne]|uniref:histidine kinase n=1 Tax=Aquamicrobium segne TaxID=469547 RepID=A0ABW0GXZ3_9HYPH